MNKKTGMSQVETVIQPNLVRWRDEFETNKEAYSEAKPFPFAVIDNFLDPVNAARVGKSFPQVDPRTWTNYIHFNEKKFGSNKQEIIPPSLHAVIQELNSEAFLTILSTLTNISNLQADDQLAGGGLHQMYRGGFLNIHSDFLRHPVKTNLRRRVNLILFLSPAWEEQYGGALEFWNKDMSRCVAKIYPVFNRCVIFNTDEYSFHGCPDPLTCPADVSRKTVALYYYTECLHRPSKLFTNYKARPVDKSKRLAIYFDNKAIAIYSWLKQKMKWNDEAASRLLRLLKRR